MNTMNFPDCFMNHSFLELLEKYNIKTYCIEDDGEMSIGDAIHFKNEIIEIDSKIVFSKFILFENCILKINYNCFFCEGYETLNCDAEKLYYLKKDRFWYKYL